MLYLFIALILVNRFNIEVFNAGPPNNKNQRTGILTFAKQTTTTNLETLDQNEVVIFCDTKRLKRMPNDPLHLFDSKANRAVGKSSGCGGNTFMYTQRFDNKWDAIQVCPWFIKYARSKPRHTKVDLTSIRATMALAGLDRLITNAFYTPIDLMSLWDKSMLHEMMHTTPGGAMNDVDEASSYGWKNCKGLALNGKGVTNPDSWALFGSAMYYFNAGKPIDKNGHFIQPALSARSNSRRRLGSGPGRASDVIKLDTVKNFV